VSRRLDLRLNCGEQVPGQEFPDPVDRMISDATKHCGHIRLRIDAVELRRSEQTVDRRGTLSAGIRSGEQIVLPVPEPQRICCLGRISPAISANTRF
jgi:hypothetical protein